MTLHCEAKTYLYDVRKARIVRSYALSEYARVQRLADRLDRNCPSIRYIAVRGNPYAHS